MRPKSARIARVLIIAAVAVSACGAMSVKISGNAMSPTLKDGESALATRSFDSLSHGDIVAFRYPKDESKSFVQRIIALPGDRIESRDGNITLNGTRLEEPYVTDANRSMDSWGPVVVPAEHYFMMGDHRNNSMDSRAWGLVQRKAVWAKVLR